MQLSKNFSVAEFTASARFPHIHNEMNQDQILAAEALCDNVLQPLRDHYGVVKINSGFRSPELNRLVGSKAKFSQHMKGEAADIVVPGVANADVWNFIVHDLKKFDQCIAELLSETNPSQGWIHVSWSRYKNRYEALSFLGKGKYVPNLKFAS